MTAPGPFTDVAYLLLAPASPGARPPNLGTWPGTERWTVREPALVKRGPDGAKLATEPASFTTVVRFARPPERMEGLRRAIEGSPDVEHSALVLGREWIAMEGSGEELAAAFIRRRCDLSVAEMQWRWSAEHVAFARALGRGYRQVHVDPIATTTANKALGFDDPELDGIALVSFPDAVTLTATRNSDAVAVDATRDEAAFLDHQRSTFVTLVPASMEGRAT